MQELAAPESETGEGGGRVKVPGCAGSCFYDQMQPEEDGARSLSVASAIDRLADFE